MPRPIKPAHEAQIPSPVAAPESGRTIVDSAYGPAVINGLNLADVAIGDPVTITHAKGPTVEYAAGSAATWSKAAAVHILADGITVAASGGTAIGVAAVAKTAGQTTALVIIG